MKPRVLVLGADTYQITLLKQLRLLGYETHVVSNRPSDPGISLADHYHPLSYLETGEVLALFKSLNAVQILSVASDASIRCQSFVQGEMGLPGISAEVIDFFTDKSVYKARLKKIEAEYIPESAVCSGNGFLEHFFERFPNGIVIKPRNGSGSANVTHLASADALKAFEWKGKPGDYLAEEFIEGAEAGGDILVYGGEVVFYHPTCKKVNRHQVPYSHVMLKENWSTPFILPFLNKLIRSLTLPDGIYNVDIIVQGNRPFLIDISPRMGGNCIPDLVHLSTGVNEWEFMIDLWMGRKPASIQPQWKRSHGVYVIGVDREGVVDEVVVNKHPFADHITEIFWKASPGQQVQAFTQGGRHLGYVIYHASSDEELLELQNKIESFPWVKLR